MKFSIVTITFNRGPLIGDTIQSVLNQSYPDFEHIIIDDGSTDNTEEVVLGFNDSRIRYIKYQKSGHRSFLRNEGFRIATGGFVSVLDSDDLWTPNKLQTLLDILDKNPTVNFIIHNLDFLPSRVVKWKPFPYKKDFSGNFLSDVLSEKMLPFPIFTIRKEAMQEIGLLDEEMVDGQQDFYFRVSAKLKGYYTNSVLTYMRKHDQNLSRNYIMTHYGDYFKSLEKLLKNGAISNDQYWSQKSKIHHKMAYIYYTRKQYKTAKESYLESFRAKSTGYLGIKSYLMYFWINLWSK